MHEAPALARFFSQGLKKPVQMSGCAGAALNGKTRRLVEGDEGLSLKQDKALQKLLIVSRQGGYGRRAALGRGLRVWRQPDFLARGHPCIGLGARAVQPDLPRPQKLL